MKKIFLKSIIVYLLLTSFLFSEIIKDVDISGNKRISKETILVLGKIKKGENFNNDKLNNSLKKLYDTNFFSDVDVNLENNLLKIRVVENPIIEDIEITGIKKKSLVTNILDRLYLKDRMSYTEDLFKRDLILLDNILKTNGYYFADVSTSLIKNDNLNSVKILMDIDIGERAKIQKIEFIGDKKIKDKKLLEVITSEHQWRSNSRASNTRLFLQEGGGM